MFRPEVGGEIGRECCMWVRLQVSAMLWRETGMTSQLTSSAPNIDIAPSTPEHSPAQSATCGSLGATNMVIL